LIILSGLLSGPALQGLINMVMRVTVFINSLTKKPKRKPKYEDAVDWEMLRYCFTAFAGSMAVFLGFAVAFSEFL
jgi:hypothetical protein